MILGFDIRGPLWLSLFLFSSEVEMSRRRNPIEAGAGDASRDHQEVSLKRNLPVSSL